MIILNNEPRLIQIASFCTLKPGANEVAAEKWAECKKLRLVQHYIEKGKKNEGGLVEKEVETLKDLKPVEAIRTVKETYDPALLTKWKQDESRARVVEAIDAQIASMTEASKKAADENKSNK